MKKLILLLLFIPLVSCGDGEEMNGGACDIPPNPEIICTKEYEPVCACNNLVYAMPVRQKKLEIYLGNQLKRIVEKSVTIKLII